MSTSVATSFQPEAYVTLVATDNYVQGAIVLGYSIRNLGTSKLLVCMVTPELSVDSVTHLSKVFDQVLFIEKLDTLDLDNLRLLGRPELGLTVSKIHIWSLTWLDTVLFLDADTLVLKPLDHLFEEYRDIPFAACPDPGWPDCFNSGVFLCKPSSKVYEDLIQLLAVQGSFDGGDQGLLNAYFDDWSASSEKRMPFIYNVTPNEVYSYAPAYKKHSKDIAVMHFIGKDKPWHQAVQKETSVDQVTKEEWQEKITEILLNKLENNQAQLFDIEPGSSSIPVESLGNKKDCVNRQDYVQKWWEVYRNNINCLSSIDDSLTSQGKHENQDVEYHSSSTNPGPQTNHQEENDLPETHATPPDVYDNHNNHNHNPHQQAYEFKTNNFKDKIHTQDREAYQKPTPQSFQKKQANSRQVPEITQVSYSFGHRSEQTTRLPFRVHTDQAKLKERPILPESALSELADRQMLTPAHQQARDANAPFPLFEAYREPRRPKKTPQVNDIQPSPQNPRDLPEKSTASQKDTSKPASPTVHLTGNSSPQSSTWPSTPANNDSCSGSGVLGVSAPHSRKIIDTLLANTVNSIPSDSPVSVKLTCVRSKPKMASNGTYTTTYKLVWEESGSQSQVSPTTNGAFAMDIQSLASTSGFLTPEPDSDNESVESLSVGSYPIVADVKVIPHDSISNKDSTVNASLNQSSHSELSKPTSESYPLFTNSSDNVKLPAPISSQQLERPDTSKTIPNSAPVGTQHSSTKLASESINQLPTPKVNFDRKPARRTPIEYQQPRSSKDGFNNYRIQWNQSELRGWRPPQNIPTASRYRDSEDPHDRHLRQRSTSEAGPNSTSPR